MSEAIDVTFTRQIDNETREELLTDLKEIAQVGDVRDKFFKSEVGGPSFIELLGGIPAWGAIAAAASPFLIKFSQMAAEDAYKALKSGSGKAFCTLWNALTKARSKVEGGTDLAIGLNIPDDYWGTVMTITRDCDDVEVAHRLAA